jgi:hypothetical protein
MPVARAVHKSCPDRICPVDSPRLPGICSLLLKKRSPPRRGRYPRRTRADRVALGLAYSSRYYFSAPYQEKWYRTNSNSWVRLQFRLICGSQSVLLFFGPYCVARGVTLPLRQRDQKKRPDPIFVSAQSSAKRAAATARAKTAISIQPQEPNSAKISFRISLATYCRDWQTPNRRSSLSQPLPILCIVARLRRGSFGG